MSVSRSQAREQFQDQPRHRTWPFCSGWTGCGRLCGPVSPWQVLLSVEMVKPEGQAQEKPPMMLLQEWEQGDCRAHSSSSNQDKFGQNNEVAAVTTLGRLMRLRREKQHTSAVGRSVKNETFRACLCITICRGKQQRKLRVRAASGSYLPASVWEEETDPPRLNLKTPDNHNKTQHSVRQDTGLVRCYTASCSKELYIVSLAADLPRSFFGQTEISAKLYSLCLCLQPIGL